MTEMDPDGDGEVTLDEFRGWWKANISAASSGGAASTAQDEVVELKNKLAEAQEKLNKVEGHERAVEGDKSLDYVKSARSKLRKIAPQSTVRITFSILLTLYLVV